MISGRCLCGTVVFKLAQQPSHFYRCHCSLCRRQTGTGHNLATLVHADQFSWLAGEAVLAVGVARRDTVMTSAGTVARRCRTCCAAAP
ncbi:GFA family protein [Pantoea ananatis]|uniref:GFA family protein n=1 Tax=Pantoea ananas TaxID=553 RepID=UPI003FA424A3